MDEEQQQTAAEEERRAQVRDRAGDAKGAGHGSVAASSRHPVEEIVDVSCGARADLKAERAGDHMSVLGDDPPYDRVRPVADLRHSRGDDRVVVGREYRCGDHDLGSVGTEQVDLRSG